VIAWKRSTPSFYHQHTKWNLSIEKITLRDSLLHQTTTKKPNHSRIPEKPDPNVINPKQQFTSPALLIDQQ
jgi:hypothetical protein